MPGSRPKEVCGYRAAHSRLVRQMGRASEYECWACSGHATEWAYDHEDRDEIDSPLGVYSLDPDRYVPMCRACHWQFDRGTGPKTFSDLVSL